MPFSKVTLLDNLDRNEKPLNNGGKWSAPSWVTEIGECTTARLAWHANAVSTLAGAYWNEKEFSEPEVVASFKPFTSTNLFQGIWACLNISNESGYRLRMVSTGSESMFKLKLEKCVSGTFSTLEEKAGFKPNEVNESYYGMTVIKGTITVWERKKEKEAAWVEIFSHADSTYTKGFVGMETNGVWGVSFFEAGGETKKEKESETFNATLTFIGFIPRNIDHQLNPSLTFLGNPQRNSSKALNAGLTFLGAVPRTVSRVTNASLTFLGSLRRNATRSLTASVSPTAILQIKTARALSAGLSFKGNVQRAAKRALTASVSFIGSIPRNIGHGLSASLSPVGKMLAQQIGKYVQGFTPELSFKGNLPRNIGYRLAAVLAPAVSFFPGGGKFVHAMTASVSFAGSLPRKTKRGFSAGLSFIGSVSPVVAGRFVQPFKAALSFVGALPSNVKGTIKFPAGTAGWSRWGSSGTNREPTGRVNRTTQAEPGNPTTSFRTK